MAMFCQRRNMAVGVSPSTSIGMTNSTNSTNSTLDQLDEHDDRDDDRDDNRDGIADDAWHGDVREGVVDALNIDVSADIRIGETVRVDRDRDCTVTARLERPCEPKKPRAAFGFFSKTWF